MDQAESTYGISKDFQRWAKAAGCTAFKSSRVYLAPLKKFQDEHSTEWEAEQSGGDGSTEAVNRERILVMRKTQRKLDREHDVAMGVLVDKENVKERSGKLLATLTGIMKKTLSKEDYNAITRQFQKVSFEL